MPIPRALPPALLAGLFAFAGVAAAQESPATEVKAPGPKVVRTQPRQLQLTWEPFGGASSYAVWRKVGRGGEWTALKEVSETSFVDKALLPRSRASYKIVLPTGQESRESAPVEALDDFYVELVYVSDRRARFHFHQWREVRSGWARSLPITLAAKELIVGTDVVGDFETQIKLLKVAVKKAKEESQADLEYVKLLTPDHRLIEVTTLDQVPKEVYDPEPKKSVAKGGKETTGKTKRRKKTRRRKKGDPIRFPEPTLIGPLPKGRLEWEIHNESPKVMDVQVRGKASYKFSIPAQTTYVVRFRKGGDFKVQINAVGDEVLALESEFGLKKGNRYKSVFAIKVLDESDPRVKNKRRNP